MKRVQWFTELRATAIALLVAALAFILSYGWGVDVFEPIAEGLQSLEKHGADEIVLSVVAFLVGVLVDSFRMSRRSEEAIDFIKI